MSSTPSQPQSRGQAHRRGRGGFRPRRGHAAAPRPRNEEQSSVPNTEGPTPIVSGINTPIPAAVDKPRFSDFTGLSKDIISSIPFETCTEVQAATLPSILTGHDVLAQAKTGTGKTLAFLVPAMQYLVTSPPTSASTTSILILSPTRELAQQINDVAEKMTATFGGRFGTRCVVGGTNMDKDVRDLKSKRADILVATPGRLLDLLENGGIKSRFNQLKMLVLDEADRLLDAGFRRELVKIFACLPDRQAVHRQTLLLSATLPAEVHSIASLALSKEYKFITTLTEEDVNAHAHVKQEVLVVPAEHVIPAAVEVFRREEAANKEFKIIAFLPTARSAALYYSIFSSLSLPYPVWEIHSRLSQSKRASTTEAFRQAERGVLFSSDVTARGIDVKGVTAVIQIGLPSSSEQYVHRLGRTARAGAEGHGILILGEFESFFLKDKTLQTFTLHPYSPITPDSLARSQSLVSNALKNVSPESKVQAYQAWLGYYNSNTKSLKWSSADLVRHANDYARDCLGYGMEPPGLLAKTVGKMGLKGVPGLKIVKEQQGQGQGQQGQRGQQSQKRERDADSRSEGGQSRGGRGRGGGGGGGGSAGRGGRGGSGARGGGGGGGGDGSGHRGSSFRGRGRGRGGAQGSAA